MTSAYIPKFLRIILITYNANLKVKIEYGDWVHSQSFSLYVLSYKLERNDHYVNNLVQAFVSNFINIGDAGSTGFSNAYSRGTKLTKIKRVVYKYFMWSVVRYVALSALNTQFSLFFVCFFLLFCFLFRSAKNICLNKLPLRYT